MRSTPAACGVALTAFLAVAAAPPPLVVERNTSDPARRITAKAQLDVDQIRLSGEVKLTLTVEGPGPLVVTPSKPLLTKGNLWRVREEGLPLREVHGPRETWTQVYRLSPLLPGDPEVPIGPLTVRPGDGQDMVLDWGKDQSAKVKVTTAITAPSPEALRPPTDIEQLPPPPPVVPGRSPWWFVVVPAMLLLSAASLLIVRRKRRPPAPRDAAWALAELAAPEPSPDRCAWVLRQYLQFRFGVPAEARTTPELTAALQADNRLPTVQVTDWQMLLDECDAARFSGTAAIVAGLADRGRGLVDAAERAPPPAAVGAD